MIEKPSSEYLVDRPALRRRLDAALSVPSTLLVAPAGAGKTVLLNQWAASHPELSIVRVDVEPADDDPVRLSRRLLDELAALRPGMGDLAHLTALNAGGLGGPLLQMISSELEAFPETVIVFDDLHNLSNRTLMGDLGRLVASVPPNVHIVISTRVDPPIAWSRLRLRNRLLELRQDELAMTREESSELLARITGRHLPASTVDLLFARTEGWAAGLQLAALTLRFQPTADGFVAELSGTDRLITEYLTEEVLDSLSADARMLLLRMAPLDTMTAELVDHVLGRSDAQRVFDRLEQESLFLVALDSRRARFRFHHLFRDLLRYRLRADDPDEEARLLGRAADFHLARGETTPAVEYLLRAREWDRALDAIMTRGSDVFERGEMHTVVRWITSVPEAARVHRHDVTLELGILVGMQGQTVRAVDTMSRVALDPSATRGERLIADAWISATAQWNPRPDEPLRAAARAVALLEADPDVEVPDLMRLTSPELLRTLAIGSGGRAHFLAGDFSAAEAWTERALATAGVAYPPFRVGLLGSLALLRIWCGRAVDAELLAAEAVDTATAAGLLTHPVIADAYLARALVAGERGRPDAAAGPLRDGSVRAEANHRTQLSWIVTCERARIAAAAGRFEEAMELVDLSAHDTASAPAPAVLDRLIATHMGMLRRTGRAEQARRLLAGPPSTPDVFAEAVAAALSTGDRETAERMLADSDHVAADGPRSEVQRSLLRAWSAELVGAHRMALDRVDAALGRAEPEGLVAVFLESDPVVLGLIEELVPARGGLAAVITARRDPNPPPDANAHLPEPLTNRELEILGHLPDHSTSAELARQCFVSVNTIKTHTTHIYRKLGVSGRSAAIARARELGLLGAVIREWERA